MGEKPTEMLVEWEFGDLSEVLRELLWPFSNWIFHDSVCPHSSRYPVQIRDDVALRVRLFAAGENSDCDIAEYQWLANGRRLRVVSSRNAVRVDFDLDQVVECAWSHGPACVQATRKWVERTLKLEGEYRGTGDSVIKYRVELPWPEKLDDGVWFSSAPDRDIYRLPGMPRWYERVDAYVENGVLSILIYKKIGQLMGYQDGSKWFPDDFRAKVLQRARELGKLPPEDK
ncbi:MAG: hypothetical protein HOP29_13850 [Phycisphaerales bacterium]|nr:hypothetical protein [Phycisphaerales bacterium]